MYTKSQRTQRTDSSIPIQTFNDSFSSRAFMMENDNLDHTYANNMPSEQANAFNDKESTASETQEKAIENKNAEVTEKTHKGKAIKIDTDDLLLLALVFLFLTGDNDKDYLLPILLGMILLFN